MKSNITPAALAAFAKGDIVNGLVAATPGGIERQEVAGQQALVANTNLPRSMGASREEITKATGIVFGDDVDDLFVSVTLPAGWRKVATDHSMHSNLLDDRGRIRAGIFYKAAFYDRSANMRFRTFYQIESVYPDKPTDDSDLPVVVKDGSDKVVREVGSAKYGDYAGGRELSAQAQAWLDANHPEHKSPWAYW